MKLTEEQRVDLPTARARALQYLARQHRLDLTAANAVAIHIWPDHQMTSQGAGAAASRILKGLQKDGAVRWDAIDGRWGYAITPKGRAEVKEL